MAIATVVSEEIRGASLQLPEPKEHQLQGPCSIAAEQFVIGSVLASPPSAVSSRAIPISRRRRAREREFGPSVNPKLLPLKPCDFWSHIGQRYWQAMLAVQDPTDITAIVEWLWNNDRISGPPDGFVSELETYRRNAAAHATLYDVSSACILILEHARSRRLVSLLARLADGICGGSENHQSAQLALREHFMAERGPVVRP
jgi:hypothetical protein